MKFIMVSQLILTATFLGIMEGELLQRAKTTGRKILFNHFSLYHFFLGSVFVLLIVIADWSIYWHVLPYIIIVQDVSSKLSQTDGQWYNKGDWSLWPFYNFNLIPIWFILLPLAFYIIHLIIKVWK